MQALTAALVVHSLALALVHIQEECGEIRTATLLPRLEELPRGLEEDIDGGVVLL